MPQKLHDAVFHLPNLNTRSGGYDEYPDYRSQTGRGQRVRVSRCPRRFLLVVRECHILTQEALALVHVTLCSWEENVRMCYLALQSSCRGGRSIERGKAFLEFLRDAPGEATTKLKELEAAL